VWKRNTDLVYFCDQINNFGGAVQDASRSSKEDERGTALATRARLGDYDEGVYSSQTTLPHISNKQHQQT
jgi:hypothetical protein